MLNKKLTIIIVNWNTEKLIIDCLDSIYENYVSSDWSVVVVDNGSIDNSVALIKEKFPQVILIENKDNCGFAAANNQALRDIASENFLLLNSDTLVLGDVIKKSVDYLEKNSKIGAMGCRVLNADKTTQYTCSMFPTLTNLLLQLFGLDKFKIWSFFSRYQYKGWERDTERDVDVISGCYLMVKSSVIDDVGLLDEDFFFFGEETDWCTRIKLAGWQLVFSPVGEIIHFGGGSVKKLNYKRDLLLSNAVVRLHKKHFGLIHAFFAALIIVLFTLTRSFAWFFIYLLTQKDSAKNRAFHFIKSLPFLHNICKNNFRF